MKVLSLETSSEICSVSIIENDKVLCDKTINNGYTHSQNLIPLLSDTLKDSNISLKDIDAFACDIGPGSFTGIRIGLSTIKAFRDVFDKPLIGVSSLEILAYSIKNNNTDFICSIIDAKNENVYYGIYQKLGNDLKQIHELKCDNINNLLQLLKSEEFNNKKIFFVGNASIIYKNMIEFELNNMSVFIDETTDLSSIIIGKIALKNLINSSYNSNEISPLYLKKSNAELEKEKSKNEFNN